jgi:hypothetical protein
MKIFETLARDPRTSALANDGQARISAADDARAIAELRAELETFVCDGQYGDAIERILRSFLENLDRSPRRGLVASTAAANRTCSRCSATCGLIPHLTMGRPHAISFTAYLKTCRHYCASSIHKSLGVNAPPLLVLEPCPLAAETL